MAQIGQEKTRQEELLKEVQARCMFEPNYSVIFPPSLS
jgi:hypothetical protein